jgi:hypothetical protein
VEIKCKRNAKTKFSRKKTELRKAKLNKAKSIIIKILKLDKVFYRYGPKNIGKSGLNLQMFDNLLPAQKNYFKICTKDKCQRWKIKKVT